MPREDDITINTVIGSGTAVSGDLHIAGFTRIDGDIDGNVETVGRIIVGEKARVRGNISAKSAIIGGVVEGDIVAPFGVEAFSSASIMGDILAKKLRLDENVLFQGRCIVIKNDEAFEKARLEWVDKKAVEKKVVYTSGDHK